MTDKTQTAKDKGNAAFKSGDYPIAIGHYTAAMLADRNDHTFPLNRAAAYLKLGKNEDAERDCTTVLALSAFNAKALFRRGQARVGMGKLDEARQDFTEALKREPANESVKEELKKVVEQLAKKNTKPASMSPPEPKRRRVPIKIIHPDDSTMTPAPISKKSDDFRSSVAETATLKPISSRTLKQPPTESSTRTSPSPSTATPVVNTPSISTPLDAQPPRTFTDAKNARDTTKPSRVGGGIFRTSGENTIFPTSGESTLSPVSKYDPTPPVTATAVETSRRKVAVPPMSLYDFSRAWESLSTTEERWSLFSTIPPSSLPGFFKISLEPTMLVSIFELFRQIGDERRKTIRDYLDYFGSIPRFETMILFLSHKEKEIVRDVLEKLGVLKSDLGSQWSSVYA